MTAFSAPPALVLLVVVLALLLLALRRGASSPAAEVLRALALGALVVALAGPLGKAREVSLDVVFALDVSASVPPAAREDALARVNAALARRPSGTRAGLVSFAAEAGFERWPDADVAAFEAPATDHEGDATNIETAIEVALGGFERTATRRIVLLSDGAETRGSAANAGAAARALGVEVHTVALDGPARADTLRLDALAAPARAHVAEPFEVEARVHASTEGLAQISVLRDGVLLSQSDVALSAGENRFRMADQAVRGGLVEYEVVVDGANDAVTANNARSAFVRVAGPPRVLHARSDAALAAPLGRALDAQGFVLEQRPADHVPSTPWQLADYELVVLDNVAAFDLPLETQAALDDYVRGGGGVLAIGGTRGFGAGGYRDTPLERLLPVQTEVETPVELPSAAVLFVLDKSGSMSANATGEDKLALARSAALAAVRLLGPQDRAGVLAFDEDTEWTVPIRGVEDAREFGERLRELDAGGSTDLRGALVDAQAAMTGVEAVSRHIIVLSDGLTDTEAAHSRLAGNLARDGVTVSVVALGRDADRALLRAIASAGNGRYYHTNEARDVPSIFVSETLIVARDLFVEGRFVPRAGYPGEPLRGIELAALPPLGGFQRTFAKPTAQTLLAAPEGEPLLATWRHGLGRAAAFTSDLGGRWGAEWVGWSQYNALVGQLARWTARRGRAGETRARFEQRDDAVLLEVDITDADGRFVSGLNLDAQVVSEARAAQRARLELVAPGRYAARFDAPGAGRYYVDVGYADVGARAGADDPAPAAREVFGFVLSSADEYRPIAADMLRALSHDTGGRLHAPDALADVFDASEAVAGASEATVWPWLVAALAALLAELVLRRRARDRVQGPADARPTALVRTLDIEREAHLSRLSTGETRPRSPAEHARLRVGGLGAQGTARSQLRT